MSPDLKLAVCFFSALGNNDLAKLEALLNKKARYIRGRVTPSLKQMKFMPSFRFLVDESFENFAKINQLLETTKPENSSDDDEEES